MSSDESGRWRKKRYQPAASHSVIIRVAHLTAMIYLLTLEQCGDICEVRNVLQLLWCLRRMVFWTCLPIKITQRLEKKSRHVAFLEHQQATSSLRSVLLLLRKGNADWKLRFLADVQMQKLQWIRMLQTTDLLWWVEIGVYRELRWRCDDDDDDADDDDDDKMTKSKCWLQKASWNFTNQSQPVSVSPRDINRIL